MGFTTPEDVGREVLHCIKDISDSKDIITAIDSSVVKPTYITGLPREITLEKSRELGKKGLSYGLLGAKVSKLISEAGLLKACFIWAEDAIKVTPLQMSKGTERFILRKGNFLRKEALSIGIPILLPDGKRFLFAKRGNKRQKLGEGTIESN
ncbi:MAG: hypothetical protein N2513_05065 [Deltaproteobacteria bacterium]|nr:hypothetical protein [Deltaproteobacteria bacterium]